MSLLSHQLQLENPSVGCQKCLVTLQVCDVTEGVYIEQPPRYTAQEKSGAQVCHLKKATSGLK